MKNRNIETLVSRDDTKKYYMQEEKYDWVKVVSTFAGMESIYHFVRQKLMQKLIRSYGKKGLNLDIGCGTGLVLCCLPNHTIGLDINRWALERAKRHAPKTQLILADADYLPFKRSVFSTVTIFEVLEHMDNPKHALREAVRVLKDSGTLIGSVPRDSPFWKLRILSSTCPQNEPFHNLYKKREVRKIFNPLARLVCHFPLWIPNFFFTAKIDAEDQN